MKNQVLQAFAILCAVAMTTSFVTYRMRQTKARVDVAVRESGERVARVCSAKMADSEPVTLSDKSYEDYYFVECDGSMHTAVSVVANYPAYNGIQGLIERAP